VNRFVILAATLLLAVGGLLAGGRVHAAAQDETTGMAEHPLVGSWLVTVSFEDVRTVPLTSLVTYAADGNVLVANAGRTPYLPPEAGLTFTGSHGVWAPTGERSADATFVFLTLDQDATVTDINTVRTAVEVDPSGDAYTGSALFEATNPDGSVTNAAPATFDATRIEVRPLAPAATPAA